MVDNGLEEVANSFAEHASAEEFVLLYVGHIRSVSYIDFDEPDDVINVPTLKKSFGSPVKFDEAELRDAIDHLNERGRLSVSKYPMQKATAGSKGKKYSNQYRVKVSL